LGASVHTLGFFDRLLVPRLGFLGELVVPVGEAKKNPPLCKFVDLFANTVAWLDPAARPQVLKKLRFRDVPTLQPGGHDNERLDRALPPSRLVEFDVLNEREELWRNTLSWVG
jgi:hypothetical protein